MDTLVQRSDLLVELRGAGEAFLGEVRGTPAEPHDDENYRVCQLVPDETSRDVGHMVISGLIDVEMGAEQISALNDPVFTWNGSITDPVVTNAHNRLVNTTECFPSSLTLLALDYVSKGYGAGDTIYDQFVRKSGALFYCEASPRDFQVSASRGGVGLYFRDPAQPDVGTHDYIVQSRLFFDQLQQGHLPGLDIHDIAHHASQMTLYGDFYKWLASNATEEVLNDQAHIRQKMLLNLILNTTIEHSMVRDGDSVQSFGCLNWQSPRKSILATGVANLPEYRINDYPYGTRDFNRWSAIRAIASIYRGQIEAEQVLSTRIDWMRQMGYNVDSELLGIVRPFQRYDYSVFPFDTGSRATITVPDTPEAMFANCRELLMAEMEGIS
jgi:hypothetical protein